jgi:hypothetical protein
MLRARAFPAQTCAAFKEAQSGGCASECARDEDVIAGACACTTNGTRPSSFADDD